MFCPVCRAEYREEIRACADCQVELVSTLPEPEHGVNRETVRVWVGSDPMQAQLYLHGLVESGIESFADRELARVFPTGELGEIGLWVNAEDEEHARNVLHAMDVEMKQVADSELEPGSDEEGREPRES